MDNKNTQLFLSKNTLFGLIIGLSYCVTAYLYYKSGYGVTTNKQLNNILMLLTIAGVFIGTRKYREEVKNGIMTYGQALGCCMYMIGIAAVVYGVFIYALYSKDPDLLNNYITVLEAQFREIYAGSPLLDSLISILKAYTSAASVAFAEIFGKIFTGFFFSLLLAGILRKKKLFR